MYLNSIERAADNGAKKIIDDEKNHREHVAYSQYPLEGIRAGIETLIKEKFAIEEPEKGT